MLTIDLSGLELVEKSPDIIADIFKEVTPRILKEIAAQAALKIKREVKTQHPQKGPYYAKSGKERFRHYRPGGTSNRLYRSIRWDYQESNGLHEVTVGSDVKHAEFIELGTKPHIIEPKTKKVLRWITPQGYTVFRRKVFHPGTKPYEHFNNAYIHWFIGAGVRLHGAYMVEVEKRLRK